MKKEKGEKALGYALRLFSIRPRSEKELCEKLFMRRFDRATISGVISVLKEKRIIDDSSFARLWIESRMRSNPKGDMALGRELREKGIPTALIEEALAEKEHKEGEAALDLARKKVESMGNLPKDKSKKKVFGLLARRGFKFDTIEDVLREIFG